MTPVGFVRGIALAFGFLGLLSGTVLFPLVRRSVYGWLQMAERVGGPRASGRPAGLTRLLQNAILLRAWQLFCAAAGFALWWYLGTANGAAWLVSTLRPH